MSIVVCISVLDHEGMYVTNVYPIFVRTPAEAEAKLRQFSGLPDEPAITTTMGNGPFHETWYRTVLEPIDPAYQGHQFVIYRDRPPEVRPCDQYAKSK